MIKLPDIKRGDTLVLNIELTDIDNVPLIISANTLKADLMKKGSILVTNLVISESPLEGTYIIELPNGFDLPIGTYYTDIQYTESGSGIVSSTETIMITIVKDETI